MMEAHCDMHSGMCSEIKNIKDTNRAQWRAIEEVTDKVDKIMNRANGILGGIVVACILLVINLIIELMKH